MHTARRTVEWARHDDRLDVSSSPCTFFVTVAHARASARYIPPGTSFWVHAYSIHRDPRNFAPHPDGFWPERWLLAAPASAPGGAGAPPDFRHDEGAFIAFSHGPMNCVGRALALQEIRTVVCALVQRFRVVRAGADVGNLRAYEGAYKDFFVSGRPGLPVVLEVRAGRTGL